MAKPIGLARIKNNIKKDRFLTRSKVKPLMIISFS
jgi:hypothetical protein